MKTKHTPGFWNVIDDSVISDNGLSIARILAPYRTTSVTHQNSPLKRQQLKYNGLLIAAAPDLLEACIHALERLECIDRLSRNDKAAPKRYESSASEGILKRAIAKATDGDL